MEKNNSIKLSQLMVQDIHFIDVQFYILQFSGRVQPHIRDVPILELFSQLNNYLLLTR